VKCPTLSRNCDWDGEYPPISQDARPLLITPYICEVRMRFSFLQSVRGQATSAIATLTLLGLSALPAAAHHPTGGDAPSNMLEGLLSGIAHPIIGVDHLAFVIATGLLAAVTGLGIWLPVAFVVASLIGTGLHLQEMDLIGVETLISASVLAFGILLASPKLPPRGWVLGLGAIAGIFHGYAYGEAVIGAEMTPILAYLVGFGVIQLGVAIAAQIIATRTLPNATAESGSPKMNLRFAGFVICGAGAAFLSAVLLG
jgi:urease accessory protein